MDYFGTSDMPIDSIEHTVDDNGNDNGNDKDFSKNTTNSIDIAEKNSVETSPLKISKRQGYQRRQIFANIGRKKPYQRLVDSKNKRISITIRDQDEKGKNKTSNHEQHLKITKKCNRCGRMGHDDHRCQSTTDITGRDLHYHSKWYKTVQKSINIDNEQYKMENKQDNKQQNEKQDKCNDNDNGNDNQSEGQLVTMVVLNETQAQLQTLAQEIVQGPSQDHPIQSKHKDDRFVFHPIIMPSWTTCVIL